VCQVILNFKACEDKGSLNNQALSKNMKVVRMKVVNFITVLLNSCFGFCFLRKNNIFVFSKFSIEHFIIQRFLGEVG